MPLLAFSRALLQTLEFGPLALALGYLLGRIIHACTPRPASLPAIYHLFYKQQGLEVSAVGEDHLQVLNENICTVRIGGVDIAPGCRAVIPGPTSCVAPFEFV